jgi:hypothetical protein
MCVPTSFLLPAIRAFCRAPSAAIFSTILIDANSLACGMDGHQQGQNFPSRHDAA